MDVERRKELMERYEAWESAPKRNPIETEALAGWLKEAVTQIDRYEQRIHQLRWLCAYLKGDTDEEDIPMEFQTYGSPPYAPYDESDPFGAWANVPKHLQKLGLPG